MSNNIADAKSASDEIEVVTRPDGFTAPSQANNPDVKDKAAELLASSEGPIAMTAAMDKRILRKIDFVSMWIRALCMSNL